MRQGHFGLSLGKTVYSILPQSPQLKNGYLAFIRQCLELMRYMLPAALEYPSGDGNGVCLIGKDCRLNISVDTRLKTE